MRKILLGTTAVVGLSLVGVAAQAQTAPSVRIGGFIEVTGNFINDDTDKAAATGALGSRTRDRQNFDFRNESEVHVFVTGKAANGLSYGATIELQMDNVGAGAPGTSVDTDEAYVFFSTPTLGTIRLGDEDSAASLLQVRVPTIAGMGPDGNWDELLSNRAGTQNAFNYTMSGINDGSDATKIIYLSPQYFGFDFGVSYAPNNGEGERPFYGTTVSPVSGSVANTSLQRDWTAISNELSAALRYRGTIGPVGVAAGLGMQNADAPRATVASATQQKLTAYTGGVQLSFAGFTVGGEYTWGQYQGVSVGRTALVKGADDSHHYVIGATYTMGALSFGGFFGQAVQDGRTVVNVAGRPDRKQTLFGVGAAYTIAPGMDLIASYNQAKDKNSAYSTTADAIARRDTTEDVSVFFFGTRLAF